MLTDQQILDKIHINIHAVRLIPKYAPSEFEKRVSALLLEKYAESCEECKAILERNKLMASLPLPTQNKGFLGKLGDLMGSK